jgi:3-isopropylmalate dehydratase small subunit
MQPFRQLTGVAAPMIVDNLDTDQILPKQFLKVVTRKGLAEALFFDERFDTDGRARPDFMLNRRPFSEAVILIGGENFGCGSSREHAVWALLDFGIRCVIAPSFAGIFFNNCANNGLLAVTLPEDAVQALAILAANGETMTVDLNAQVVILQSGETVGFQVDPQRRQKLLAGLDAIGETLLHEQDISHFEQAHPRSLASYQSNLTGPPSQ